MLEAVGTDAAFERDRIGELFAADAAMPPEPCRKLHLGIRGADEIENPHSR